MGVMGSIGKQASLSSLWFCSFLAMATMVAHGDYASDYKECAPSLVKLTVCIPYASKQAPKPTLACCSKLKVIIHDEPKCLCILIRRYNAPVVKQQNLNLDRTLNLPNSCDIPANVSKCPGLLGIDPNSPEAEIFMGKKSNLAAPGSSAQMNGTEEKQEKSGSGRTMGIGYGVTWWTVEALRGFLIASLTAILAS